MGPAAPRPDLESRPPHRRAGSRSASTEARPMPVGVWKLLHLVLRLQLRGQRSSSRTGTAARRARPRTGRSARGSSTSCFSRPASAASDRSCILGILGNVYAIGARLSHGERHVDVVGERPLARRRRRTDRARAAERPRGSSRSRAPPPTGAAPRGLCERRSRAGASATSIESVLYLVLLAYGVPGRS